MDRELEILISNMRSIIMLTLIMEFIIRMMKMRLKNNNKSKNPKKKM